MPTITYFEEIGYEQNSPWSPSEIGEILMSVECRIIPYLCPVLDHIPDATIIESATSNCSAIRLDVEVTEDEARLILDLWPHGIGIVDCQYGLFQYFNIKY